MNQNKVQVRVPSEERLFSICSIFRSVNRDSYVYVLLELYSSPRLLPHPAGGTNKSGLPPPGKNNYHFWPANTRRTKFHIWKLSSADIFHCRLIRQNKHQLYICLQIITYMTCFSTTKKISNFESEVFCPESQYQNYTNFNNKIHPFSCLKTFFSIQ